MTEVRGRLALSGSETCSDFRLEEGAGEDAREAGGDGGKVAGRGSGRLWSIYDESELAQGQRGGNQLTWRLLRSDSWVHLLDRKMKRHA